ncbi:hypothetical protein NDU88_001904 [Pleurodeles waltl]|uniref:Uncharacterized protein n=1 Tax=Pleurodeles waltl TaxID=8319 RepID=A0AAV7W2X6_PLEWA|nr:hypothetical protein NDU88_001904 [Pleurodeles waltl]
MMLPGARKDQMDSTQEEEEEVALSSSESPHKTTAACTEVPQHRDKEGANSGPSSTMTKAPTPPENHSGKCALQDRVLGAGAAKYMKNFVEGCQQALATAKNMVHRGTVLRGKASSFLHQSWTVGHQDHLDHFSLPPVMQDPCSSAGEGIHAADRRRSRCLLKKGSNFFTPREIPLLFWCRLKTGRPQRMRDWETITVAARS